MKLNDFATFNPDWDKEEIRKKTDHILEETGELQNKMFAGAEKSLLIVLQGLDASGKDGVTRKLLRYCNPIGVKIKSFKKPSAEEYAHDFLWRIHKEIPAKGEFQVFIRSHYEDILVPTVEKIFPKQVIDKRYGMINDFEKMLERQNIRILKFFLHVSPEVQEKRLRERIEKKKKHWKHNDDDWETRKKFDEYIRVYEKIFEKCGDIPWHIVPADKNWQKLYAVADVVLAALRDMKPEWPELETEVFK